MVSAAELLEAELPAVAALLTTEMGKTFASAKGEVAKCALGMRYYAEHAERYLADRADRDLRQATAASATSRSAPCSRSCRGTSRCGR